MPDDEKPPPEPVRLDERVEPSTDPLEHEAVTIMPPRPSQSGPSRASPAAAMSRHVGALQQELSRALRRLKSVQDERMEEADHLAELLTQLDAMGTRYREAEAGRVDLTIKFEQERETSAWLRDAGARSTREVAELRARVEVVGADEASRIAAERAASAQELARLGRELQAATDELAAARTALATASARLSAAQEEAAELSEARAAVGEAVAAALELERELEAANAEGEARAARLAEEAQRAAARSEKDHGEALVRLENEHEQRVTAVANEAAGRIRAISAQLSGAEAATAALRAERDSLAKAVERADIRTRTVKKELDATTGMLADMIRALEALEQGQEQIAKLRDEAHSARTIIADRAVALRLTMSRAADAGVMEEDLRASEGPPPRR